jgi:hypothetical protein
MITRIIKQAPDLTKSFERMVQIVWLMALLVCMVMASRASVVAEAPRMRWRSLRWAGRQQVRPSVAPTDVHERVQNCCLLCTRTPFSAIFTAGAKYMGMSTNEAQRLKDLEEV